MVEEGEYDPRKRMTSIQKQETTIGCKITAQNVFPDHRKQDFLLDVSGEDNLYAPMKNDCVNVIVEVVYYLFQFCLH